MFRLSGQSTKSNQANEINIYACAARRVSAMQVPLATVWSPDFPASWIKKIAALAWSKNEPSYTKFIVSPLSGQETVACVFFFFKQSKRQ